MATRRPRLPKKKALSSTTAKRHRVPQVDVDVNPFCQDRQLDDELALMALNRNPQLLQPTAEEITRRASAMCRMRTCPSTTPLIIMRPRP